MRRSLLTSLAVFALLLTTAFAPEPLAAPPAASVQSIAPQELREHLYYLASKDFGGRYTLSPQFQIAATFLASQLQAYGYKGAADGGSFFQSFELSTMKVEQEKCSLSVKSGGNKKDHAYGDFFNAGTSGGTAEGEIVWVGYGISAARLGHDDYAGLNVKGKIVMFTRGTPQGLDPSLLKDEEREDDAAVAHGAAGAIVLPDSYRVNVMKNPRYREFGLERVRLTKAARNPIPAVWAGPELSDQLLKPLGLDLKTVNDSVKLHVALAPKATGMSAALNVSMTETKQTTQNVTGVLEGSDPKLKGEYIMFSAHYDHLRTNTKGDIFPGADDDGSGTVSVLAIAKAMAQERPKRSVLIVFHAGEELGLLGSLYNADYAPVVPLEKIAADINIDMIGRSKPAGDTDKKDEQLTAADTIYAIGADRISKEFDDLHTRTNKDFENLKIDYTLNDPKHPDRIYFRSDHWNYAKHGVPILFYFDGVHVDYHQPTDTVDKIDFDKMARVAKLAFETGWRVAQLDHRLKVTEPAAKP